MISSGSSSSIIITITTMIIISSIITIAVTITTATQGLLAETALLLGLLAVAGDAQLPGHALGIIYII